MRPAPPLRAAASLLACGWLCAPAFAAPAPASPRPVLDRVRVPVRDLPAAADWFEKVLGWTPSYRDARRAVFAAPGFKVELGAAAEDGRAALVLSGADADADYARLVGRGAAALEAPRDRPSGVRAADVRGPGALVISIEGPLAAPPDFEFSETSPGTGATPRPGDTVKVRYVGALKDGTVFDGGHKTGRPALVPLSSAIPCWTQALIRMKAGGKARFVCPPAMAYGKEGRAPRIPPDATLVFDVELVDVPR